MSDFQIHAASRYNGGLPRKSKHGDARRGKHAPEWNHWFAMLNRCNNPKQENYPRYGGRGIRVCRKWSSSYLEFLLDMGRMPGVGYSIDRIDNDGDYEPGNCRWATRTEQQNNRRNTVRILDGALLLSPMEWSRMVGIPGRTILRRIKAGWTIRDALTLKPSKRNPKHELAKTN